MAINRILCKSLTSPLIIETAQQNTANNNIADFMMNGQYLDKKDIKICQNSPALKFNINTALWSVKGHCHEARCTCASKVEKIRLIFQVDQSKMVVHVL